MDLSKKLKSFLLASAFALTGASGANGFHFQFTGTHTDSSTEIYFHDGGDNFGPNDLIVTFGGQPFSLISLTWIIGLGMTITGSDGQSVHIPGGSPLGTHIDIGIINVVSATFDTQETGSGFNLLILDTEPPQPVPEPTLGGLLVLAPLAAVAATRRRLRA